MANYRLMRLVGSSDEGGFGGGGGGEEGLVGSDFTVSFGDTILHAEHAFGFPQWTSGGFNGAAISPIDGAVYMSCEDRHVVLRVSPEDRLVTVFGGVLDEPGYAGDGDLVGNAKFNYPRGLEFDPSGNLYICDHANHRVRKVDVNGIITTYFGTGVREDHFEGPLNSGSGLAPSVTKISGPSVVCYNAVSNILWVGCSSQTGNLFWRVGATCTQVSTAGPGGFLIFTSGGNTYLPYGLVADPLSSSVYLLLKDVGVVRKFSDALTFTDIATPTTDAGTGFFYPGALGIDSTGKLFIFADGLRGGSDLYTKTPAGSFTRITDVGTVGASGTHETSFPSDGTNGQSALPETSIMISRFSTPPPADRQPTSAGKMLVDKNGIIYVLGSSYLWKYVPLPSLLLEGYGSPRLMKTVKPGFTDQDTIDMLTSGTYNLPGAVVENIASTRPTTDLSAFKGVGVNRWMLGSSYSNDHADQVERFNITNRKILREMSRCLVGVNKVDFQDRGAGDGNEYGSDGPRIRVVNKNGDFLVERWLDEDGVTVHDYGIVLAVEIASEILIYAAGIRDISTKGAAFVARNTNQAAFLAFYSVTNALLVHCKYPITTVAPVAFTPVSYSMDLVNYNVDVMRLANVNSTRPVPGPPL